MSENVLTVIPVDPAWRPSRAASDKAVDVVRAFAPNAAAVAAILHPTIVFVDAGSNFQTVSCPACGAPLEMAWWGEQMDAATPEFTDRSVTLPCCGSTADLNDLLYDWPQGFARWCVEVQSPNRGSLCRDELEAIVRELGVGVRQVWSH